MKMAYDSRNNYEFNQSDVPKPPKYLGNGISDCRYCKAFLFRSDSTWYNPILDMFKDIVGFTSKLVVTFDDGEEVVIDYTKNDVGHMGNPAPSLFKTCFSSLKNFDGARRIIERMQHRKEKERLAKRYPNVSKDTYKEWLGTLIPGNSKKPGCKYFHGIVRGFGPKYECEYTKGYSSGHYRPNHKLKPFTRSWWFERWPTEEETVSMLISLDHFSFGVPKMPHGHGN